MSRLSVHTILRRPAQAHAAHGTCGPQPLPHPSHWLGLAKHFSEQQVIIGSTCYMLPKTTATPTSYLPSSPYLNQLCSTIHNMYQHIRLQYIKYPFISCDYILKRINNHVRKILKELYLQYNNIKLRPKTIVSRHFHLNYIFISILFPCKIGQ